MAANERKGYRLGWVLAPAVAEIMGSGTGLSGAASAYVGYRRTDGGFSRNVEIVSDGRCLWCADRDADDSDLVSDSFLCQDHRAEFLGLSVDELERGEAIQDAEYRDTIG
jgi:hypothetical protein